MKEARRYFGPCRPPLRGPYYIKGPLSSDFQSAVFCVVLLSDWFEYVGACFRAHGCEDNDYLDTMSLGFCVWWLQNGMWTAMRSCSRYLFSLLSSCVRSLQSLTRRAVELSRIWQKQLWMAWNQPLGLKLSSGMLALMNCKQLCKNGLVLLLMSCLVILGKCHTFGRDHDLRSFGRSDPQFHGSIGESQVFLLPFLRLLLRANSRRKRSFLKRQCTGAFSICLPLVSIKVVFPASYIQGFHSQCPCREATTVSAANGKTLSLFWLWNQRMRTDELLHPILLESPVFLAYLAKAARDFEWIC